MSETKTYGVGPSAEKLNIGASHSTVSVLHDDGTVTVDGKTVFDPSTDPIEIDEQDGELSAQAKGEDEGPTGFDQTSRTRPAGEKKDDK